MKRGAVFQFCCLVFFLGLASVAHGDSWATPGKKYFIRIVNNLDNKQLAFVRKSADDVISHSLPHRGDQFEFGFRLNFFGTTLYFCNLKYQNHHVVFDAWKLDKQLLRLCGGGVHCIWRAQEDGIYLFNTQWGSWIRKYVWNN